MTIGINLAGKVALVTGGGRGIGRAIALALAEAGADVCVCARTVTDIEETANRARAMGRSALAVGADASDAGQVEAVVDQTVDQLGGLHLLVNNAGTQVSKPLMDTTEAEYDRVMDTNVKSMFLFTRAAGRHFIAQSYGRVVNIASVAAIVAGPNQPIYNTSKGAVAQFTKSMAIDWARHNVRVNAVAPGWVKTDLIAPLLADEQKLARYVKAIPQRRLGTPEDIAPLVAFLCTDLSDYMTGAILVVDGGLTIP